MGKVGLYELSVSLDLCILTSMNFVITFIADHKILVPLKFIKSITSRLVFLKNKNMWEATVLYE